MTSSITYRTVVSQYFVRICVTIAAINDIHVLAAEVENDYILALCCEQVWMRVRPEFGNSKGKVLIIMKALYGLKSSGAAFWAYLSEKSDNVGFKSSIANPHVYQIYHYYSQFEGTE